MSTCPALPCPGVGQGEVSAWPGEQNQDCPVRVLDAQEARDMPWGKGSVQGCQVSRS